MIAPRLHMVVSVAEQVINPFSISHLNTYIILGKGDKTRAYTRMRTPKLHVAVRVEEQVINPFPMSHITDVGRLDHIECISSLYFFFVKNIHKQIV